MTIREASPSGHHSTLPAGGLVSYAPNFSEFYRRAAEADVL